MKKPNRHREEILLNAAIKRLSRLWKIRASRRIEHRRFIAYTKIKAPLVVSLENPAHHTDVSAFCEKLRKSIYHSRNPTVIDFSDTNKFVSGGTLVIFAEISRLLELTAYSVPVDCIAPRNNKASQVLKQIGLYKLLKKRVPIKIFAHDVIKWCAATGMGAEGSKFEPILGAYDGKITKSLSTGLFNNITEAMTNTGQHAFIKSRDDGIPDGHEIVQRWWMFSQERDGYLTVAFCDLGAGIPNTLNIKYPTIVQNLKQAVGLKIKDSNYLSEAIKLGNSRTGKSFRGKGLYRMVRLIEQMEGGQLLIYSNSGRLEVSSKGIVLSDYSKSLYGTVIFFRVPLDADPVIYEH
ncbi:hypothetical protein BH11PSE12_BH11PSE12_20750 [soil metagenome]